MRFTKIRTLVEFVELFVDLRKGRGLRTHETNIHRNGRRCVLSTQMKAFYDISDRLFRVPHRVSLTPDTVFLLHFAFLI